LNSLDKFSDNIQISNLTKIRTGGAELFHADGQMDRHNVANSRFFAILRTRLKTDHTLNWFLWHKYKSIIVHVMSHVSTPSNHFQARQLLKT